MAASERRRHTAQTTSRTGTDPAAELAAVWQELLARTRVRALGRHRERALRDARGRGGRGDAPEEEGKSAEPKRSDSFRALPARALGARALVVGGRARARPTARPLAPARRAARRRARAHVRAVRRALRRGAARCGRGAASRRRAGAAAASNKCARATDDARGPARSSRARPLPDGPPRRPAELTGGADTPRLFVVFARTGRARSRRSVPQLRRATPHRVASRTTREALRPPSPSPSPPPAPVRSSCAAPGCARSGCGPRSRTCSR